MLRLGEKQKLTVIKTVDFGVYLAESPESADERVLLPKAQIPEGLKIGDELEVKVNEIDAQGRINLIRNDIEYTNREPARHSEGGNRRPPRRTSNHD